LKLSTKKVAIFGTSADPPSNGHKLIIEELSNIYDLVICYASNNPSKKHEENLFFRSLLLETLINNLSSNKIKFDQDISSPWAIETIKRCKKKYMCKYIDFVIGSDLLAEICLWKNIIEFLKEVKLLIIPREDFPINPKNINFIKNNFGRFEISKLKVPRISSSMIRMNKTYEGLPKSVISIIENNRLYNYPKINK
tara:strand:+ start:6464 stop:7051 length:588 start_codon:yes stop_codon:yes gene_type:complete